MSYCRFSTDDFSCDLYCYESSDGWVTHVAANRPVGEVPATPRDWHSVTPEELSDAMNRQIDFLRACARAPIGLPHDGATFLDATARAFLSRLLHLRAVGYRFPDHVLAQVAEESDEPGDVPGDESFTGPCH